jgi:hypothetical protein
MLGSQDGQSAFAEFTVDTDDDTSILSLGKFQVLTGVNPLHQRQHGRQLQGPCVIHIRQALMAMGQ